MSESTAQTEANRLTHVVEHFCPSLHSDALEDGEYGKQDVVELGDARVWSKPAALAHGTVGTLSGRRRFATWQTVHNFL